MQHADAVGKFMLNIYDQINCALESDDIDQIADAVLAADLAKREIADMCEAAKTALIEKMGDRPEFQHDGFVFERKNGSPRKTWDHHSLGEIVAQRLINLSTDMDTGELTRSPVEIAVDMLTFAAPSYWRVTELNKIGVNADNYCDVGEPKTNIIIRKAS